MTKEAKAAYDRVYRARKATEIAAYKRGWHQRNKDRQYQKLKERRADQVLRAEHNRRCREWRKTNPDRARAVAARSYMKNREKKRTYGAWYVREFNWKVNARTMQRIAKKKLATPKWADNSEIEAVYKQAAEMSNRDGVTYHVDHIYPLQGRTVTGLHVHTNLQILTATENCRKGNRAWL